MQIRIIKTSKCIDITATQPYTQTLIHLMYSNKGNKLKRSKNSLKNVFLHLLILSNPSQIFDNFFSFC